MTINVYSKITLLRRISQIITILILFLIPILTHYFGIYFIMGNMYSFGVGGFDIADPLIVLQAILLSKSIYLPLIIAGIFPIVLALIFGRVFCSWMCPQNTLSELVHWLKKKIYKKKKKTGPSSKNPSGIFYWSSIALSLTIALLFAFPFVHYISAPGIISSRIATVVIGTGIGLESLLIPLVLLIEVSFLPRGWCKYICPVGAFLSIFRINRTMKVYFEEEKCICAPGKEIGKNACQLGLDPRLPSRYPSCHNCGDCIRACQKVGKALSFSFALDK